MSPLAERLSRKKILILDGGLATELERKGCDLNHPLWSAKLLLEQPEKIKEVHLSYLEAGADCIITCGYQASLPGLAKSGLSAEQAKQLYLDSIRVAVQARRVFCSRKLTSIDDMAFIAASVGSYGAYLADGSEYRGNYLVAESELERFHRARIEMVAQVIREEHEGPDLVAFETIPSLQEALLLARILESFPGIYAWMSFACQNNSLTCEGQRIEECARELEAFPQIAAI